MDELDSDKKIWKSELITLKNKYKIGEKKRVFTICFFKVFRIHGSTWPDPVSFKFSRTHPPPKKSVQTTIKVISSFWPFFWNFELDFYHLCRAMSPLLYIRLSQKSWKSARTKLISRADVISGSRNDWKWFFCAGLYTREITLPRPPSLKPWAERFERLPWFFKN